ncbi:hypothetical protein [Desulfosporosinus fructosivorans]
MLKTYETFKSTVEKFDKAINDLIVSADQAEETVKDLQGQKVNALMTGDVAGAVLLTKQIHDNQEIVSHNRESAELMRMGKWKAFIGMIDDIDADSNKVVVDCLKRFDDKAAAVAKLKAAYMQGLSELGAIRQEAKDAAHNAADARNLVSTFEGNPQPYRHTNTTLTQWDDKKLFRPNKRDGISPVGVIAVTENEQRLAYAPKELIPNYLRES